MTTARRSRLLPALDADERGRVLDDLLRAHPELRDEAEAIAAAHLKDVDPAEVADRVAAAFLDQSYMDISDRVGRQPGGWYVHEAEAQIELLQETLAPYSDEIARLAKLDLAEAALDQAHGVLDGLLRLRAVAGQSTLIGWGDVKDLTWDLAEGVRITCREARVDLPEEEAERWW